MLTPRAALALALLLPSTPACSRTHGGGADAGDGGAGGDGADVLDAADCPAVRCAAGCTTGRGADGCPLCRCPDASTAVCASDDDCVIAGSRDACCACAQAYPRAWVDEDPCLARWGEPVPSLCDAGCDGVACGACLLTPEAACEAGRCVGREICPSGEVLDLSAGECVPPCASHADCAVASPAGGCCGPCWRAIATVLVEERECVVGPGDPVPEACRPADGECDDVGCPAYYCPEGAAVCMEDGTCQQVSAAGECPTGYADDGTRCVA